MQAKDHSQTYSPVDGIDQKGEPEDVPSLQKVKPFILLKFTYLWNFDLRSKILIDLQAPPVDVTHVLFDFAATLTHGLAATAFVPCVLLH
jgi:hypothetical protein